jgi:glycosidase
MTNSSPSKLPWWKRTTVYQIYPRSFKDSTGNGIGDLQGIISKLDYLQDLGIETIWFSPFFSSPQADHGYDVSDYRDIAPEYGTMKDCEQLIKEIHNRGMFIVLDLVLNHTSNQHPWFLESRSSCDNPKRNWYIWRDGAKPRGKRPPNNWNSMVGGSGWHYDDLTDQWYWAQFLPFQPDLNYRNPEVKIEMFDTVRFWLEKGIDGFRLDIINTIYEDPEFRNNPFAFAYLPSEEHTKSFFHDNIYTINHPDDFKFVKELRQVIDEFSDPERFLVGEITASLPILKQFCGEMIDDYKTNGLHMTFQFQSLAAKFNADTFRSLIQNYEQIFPEPYIPTWVFSNHDQVRRISRLGGNIEKAKLNATLQLTTRGVPFIYYGEEIGMLQADLPLKEAQDPIAQKYAWLPRPLSSLLQKIGDISLNRDECRTPMQWDTRPNAGFCPPNVSPWLLPGLKYEEINIEVEENAPDSLLSCYKQLLKLRQDMPALHSGSITIKEIPKYNKELIVYRRKYNSEFRQVVEVWLNFSNKQLHYHGNLPSYELKFSTNGSIDSINDSGIHLEPYQGIVLENLDDVK